jgi:hypothetical protein
MIESVVIMLLSDLLVFFLIGVIILARLRDVKGSLNLAKICIAMTSFSAAAAFLMSVVLQIVYNSSDPQSGQLVAELFVPTNFFAMLVLAFLASFAVFATYGNGKRKLLVLLIFMVALVPTAYLAFTWSQTVVSQAPSGYPESYQLQLPPLTFYLFALCGIPLGLVPLVAFSKSLIMAQKRGDRTLSRRALIMLLSLLLNEVAYALFGFSTGLVELITIILWIPIAFFLLFAVIKITSPLEP